MTRVTQQHVDARREAIMDAALRLCARKGIDGATMSDIAQEADLSAGAIYRYFSSKEDLLRAVFDEVIAQKQEVFSTAAQSSGSPLAALEEIGRQAWVNLEDRDEMVCEIQMTLAATQDPDDFGIELSRTSRVLRDLLTGMVQEAQASGEIDPNVDSTTLAVILQACTSGIQMLKLDKRNEIDVEAAFDLFRRMVVGLRSDDVEDMGR